MIQDAGCNVACDYVQVDESTLPVIDNEKRRAVKGYVWSVVNVMTGDRFFFYEHGSRSARVAMGLLKDFTGAIQSDGYIVYEHFEGMEGKKLLGCWAHARRKFFEAKVENEKLALEALSYICGSMMWKRKRMLLTRQTTNPTMSAGRPCGRKGLSGNQEVRDVDGGKHPQAPSEVSDGGGHLLHL